MTTLSDKIQHIVVLMMENRSFDSMLGGLYPDRPEFNGLKGQESNPLPGSDPISVWSSNAIDPVSMSIPTPDPGELWTDMNTQLFGQGQTPNSQPPNMSGFVANYINQPAKEGETFVGRSIMHYYSPTQVPVLSTLAREFAVCDQWHASAPCQTWPNRFFLHCATANGYENNNPVHFPYMMNTVFNQLEEVNKSWKIYFHDFPQSLTLTRLWPHYDHFHQFTESFEKDCNDGTLPDYSFIEPQYFPELTLPNDQHPPHHVGMGEELMASVYNILRKSPAWKNTLLIIIYDEHGGCYDHAPPPLAISPDTQQTHPFAFDRYGVRIPAVLVSPYIQPGTILQASGNNPLPHHGPPYPFDHTSVISTIRETFGLRGPLTRRDAVAPTLETVLMNEEPSNDGPAAVTHLPYQVSPTDLEKALNAPLNDFQKGLHDAAHFLPILKDLGADDKPSAIKQRITDIVNNTVDVIPEHLTPADALPFIKDKLDKLFN